MCSSDLLRALKGSRLGGGGTRALYALPWYVIIGPPGSGKSTALRLVQKLYEPQKGRVLVDGMDVAELDADALNAQIALVPQETVLFGGTILDNIRYGRADASEEDVFAASRAANAHDFIVELPDGYNTMVGEKGVNLSGGQRQIGRAHV